LGQPFLIDNYTDITYRSRLKHNTYLYSPKYLYFCKVISIDVIY